MATKRRQSSITAHRRASPEGKAILFSSIFCLDNGVHYSLLSQWRGYGEDGGYAIQFSRTKLKNTIDQINSSLDANYDLLDVLYTVENSYKADVTKYADVFINAYLEYLDEIIKIRWQSPTFNYSISGLTGGPLEAFLTYLINTKNEHFGEEKECRLSMLETNMPDSMVVPVEYFNRHGLIIPFTRTPDKFPLNDCIDWVIVGPTPGIEQRFMSLKQMIKKMGLNIDVRPSHIPFSRAFQ